MVVDHFQQCLLKRAICLPLFRLKSIDLLPNERVCSHDIGKTGTIGPELLELMYRSGPAALEYPQICSSTQAPEQGMDPGSTKYEHL